MVLLLSFCRQYRNFVGNPHACGVGCMWLVSVPLSIAAASGAVMEAAVNAHNLGCKIVPWVDKVVLAGDGGYNPYKGWCSE